VYYYVIYGHAYCKVEEKKEKEKVATAFLTMFLSLGKE
jgi:hypothetical protein